MAQYKISLASKEKVGFGEGPHWNTSTNTFTYVDCYVKELILLKLGPENVGKTKFKVPVDSAYFSAAVPISGENGQFIGVANNKLIKFSTNSRTAQILYETESGREFNDAKCDSWGRLWVGEWMHKLSSDSEPSRGPDELYAKNDQSLRSLTKGLIKAHACGMAGPNGIAFSPDETQIFTVDSLQNNIGVQAFDADSGELHGERADLYTLQPEKLGLDPKAVLDGMVTDVKGNLWVAINMGGRVLNIDAETGKMIAEITFDAPLTTSLCFGGHHLNQLLVTSASVPSSWSMHVNPGQNGGHIFSVTCERDNGFRGLSMHSYTI